MKLDLETFLTSGLREDSSPRVFKVRGSVPPGAAYVGRNPRFGDPKWGNPFTHISEGTTAIYVVASREEAIQRYREWILKQPELLSALHELQGKDLYCHCAPLACHGEVLLELARNIPGQG